MVVVLLGNGFEESEAIVPADILKRCGIDVKFASVGNDLTVIGSHGFSVVSDMFADDIDYNLINLLVLPGGVPGINNLDSYVGLDSLLNHCVFNSIPIGAICAAPSLLAKRGILSGHKAVCYPGFEKSFGINTEFCSHDRVVKSGFIITACAASASAEFGFSLASFFVSDEVISDVKSKLLI